MTSHSQRRPALWLAMLLAFHFLLLSVQVRDEKGRTLLRSWGLLLASPLADGVHLALSSAQSFLDRYILLADAEEENRRLRRENARLKVETARLRALAALLPRSREYDELKRSYQFRSLLANVTGRGAPYYGSRLLIDAGTIRQVNVDDAVLSPEGIVGRVVAASPFNAEVELIINEGAGAGALIEGSRLQGVVRGTGSELLRLDYIPNVESVEEGAVVVTSGADQVYPKGLPIGVVVSSQKSSMIYREISVRPAVDFSRLEEVLVALADSQPGTDAALQGPAAEGSR